MQAIYIQRTDSVCIWYWVYCVSWLSTHETM